MRACGHEAMCGLCCYDLGFSVTVEMGGRAEGGGKLGGQWGRELEERGGMRWTSEGRRGGKKREEKKKRRGKRREKRRAEWSVV